MESIKLDGVTYKVGDILKFIKHDKVCVLKKIYKQNGIIFFDVIKEGESETSGGYFPYRFKHYKKSNIFNY